MKKRKIKSKTKDINIDKIFKEVIAYFQKRKFTVKELLTIYGNLGYVLGLSISSKWKTSTKPTVEILTEDYKKDPRVDNALMLQGLQTVLWGVQLEKQLENNEKENQEKK